MVNGYVNLPEELHDILEYTEPRVIKGIHNKIKAVHESGKLIVADLYSSTTNTATVIPVGIISNPDGSQYVIFITFAGQSNLYSVTLDDTVQPVNL